MFTATYLLADIDCESCNIASLNPSPTQQNRAKRATYELAAYVYKFISVCACVRSSPLHFVPPTSSDTPAVSVIL